MINSEQIQKEGNSSESKEQLKTNLKVRKSEIHFEEEINYLDSDKVL